MKNIRTNKLQDASADEVFSAVMKLMKPVTEIQEIAICIDHRKTPQITDSKFGGTAYWPAGKQYPSDSKGVPMVLLAQFNCSQLPKTGRLPETGMLQFFVEQVDNVEARVVFHEYVDPAVTETSSIAAGALDFKTIRKYDCPVLEEFGIQMMGKTVYMPPSDYRFDDLFATTAAHAGVRAPQFCDLDISDDVYKDAVATSMKHHLFGYPFFTQGDPRYPSLDRDVLLFQMDSDGIGKETCIIWGDCGVGNFFISEKDLENRNFENTYFTWDCC